MSEKLFERRLPRYLLAGIGSYAIELGVLIGLHRGAGLSAEAATAVAFWFGLAASFGLQKLFAFKDYRRSVGILTHQSLKYGLLVAFNYAFTLSVVAIFPARWVIFSRSLALIITTGWNYYLYRRFIFSAGANA